MENVLTYIGDLGIIPVITIDRIDDALMTITLHTGDCLDVMAGMAI